MPNRVPSFWDDLLRGPAGVVGALTALGFLFISPGEQIKALQTTQAVTIAKQTVRDSLQDVRLTAVELKTDSTLRTLRADMRSLVLAQCLGTKDRATYAQLECAKRLGR